MKNKKLIFSFVSILLLSSLLIGCNNKETNEEKEKVYNIDGFTTETSNGVKDKDKDKDKVEDKDVVFSGVRDAYGLSVDGNGKYILKMKNIDKLFLKEIEDDGVKFKEDGDIIVFEFKENSYNKLYSEYDGATLNFLNSINQIPGFDFIYKRDYDETEFLLTLEVDSSSTNLNGNIKNFIENFNDVGLTEAALKGELVDKEIKFIIKDKDNGEIINYD